MIPQCAIRKLFGLVEKYANNKEERIWLNGFFSGCIIAWVSSIVLFYIMLWWLKL